MASSRPPSQESSSGSSGEPGNAERLASSVSLTDIASLVASQLPAFAPPSLPVVDPTPVCGSYNVVFFVTRSDAPGGHEEKVVVRVPAPEVFDAVSFEADVQVLKLLGEETTLPVPKVLAYRTTGDDSFRHPFAILSYLPGVSLATVWYSSMSESQQHSVLEQLASCMLQLSRFTYPQLGDLVFDREQDKLVVAPLRDRDRPQVGEAVLEPDESFPFVSSGPFSTAAEMHEAVLSRLTAKNAAGVSFLYVATRVLEPIHLNAGPFVLGHPDLDVQNVLVDPETFEVTGLIDWDAVSRTLPPANGFGRYPSWITRDWDPLRYGWQDPDVPVSNPEAQLPLLHREESPTELANHRKTFFSAVREIDAQLARDVTKYSHVHEALAIALEDPVSRGGIEGKLLDYIFGGAPDELRTWAVLPATKRSEWWREMGSKDR